MLAGQLDDLGLVARVDELHREPVGIPELGLHFFGPFYVVVAQYELLEPGLVLGDDRQGLADSTDSNQQDLHINLQ